jgi:hypothetical protein
MKAEKILEELGSLLQRIKLPLPKIPTRPVTFAAFLKRMGYFFGTMGRCEGHRAPLEFLFDAFLERTPSLLVWGPRSGGKSLTLALLTWLNSLYKPGCQTRVLAGSLEQGQQVYSHTLSFWERFPEAQALLATPPRKTVTVLKNRSEFRILTASQTSIRGPHPQKLIIDEVDELAPDLLEAALSQPVATLSIKSTIVIASTLHRAGGVMDDLIGKAGEMGFKLYPFCILDVAQRCQKKCERGETPSGLCNLWEDCRGLLKRKEGYFPIEELQRKKRTLPRKVWEIEWLCQKPITQTHVFPPDLIRARTQVFVPSESCQAVIGVDWGYSQPTVALIVLRRRNHLHVMEEHYWTRKLLAWRIQRIASLFERWKAIKVFADAADPTANAALSAANVPVVPIRFSEAFRKKAIENINWRLENKLLTFSPTCTRLLQELLSYKFKPGTDEVIREKDHGPDALQAALFAFKPEEEEFEEIVPRTVEVQSATANISPPKWEEEIQPKLVQSYSSWEF